MAEPREPKFQWGQPVITETDLVNDGSYPDAPLEALLAAQGARGEIVNVGLVEETGEPVYLVEFADGKVVGVFEEELSPA
ncbi:MAG TPA: nitrogen fixation protein NifZ [Novimethylophilus sp.]|jgi:nitrogen fixation protein NifZ|uniref:nitrogen fixation protein NifZ n=1 Tax=Novimethylophilus sp. TaxID=2137426 RepID=UPI002F40F379